MIHFISILKIQLLIVAVLFVMSVSFSHAEDFFFDSDGVRIHYTVEGRGEPVVLIPGFGGNIKMWEDSGIIKELSDVFMVITMDPRGHGESDKPRDPKAYGNNLTDDPIRLLDELKIQKTHVVGYSMGGFITLGIVAQYSERLQSAVLGGAGWSPPDGDSAMLDALVKSLEQGNGIGPLAAALKPVGSEPPTPEEVEEINNWFLPNNDQLALAALIRGSDHSRLVTEDHLRANKVPVLALIGEKDAQKTNVDGMEGLMSNLEISVIPKADHMTALSDPLFVQGIKSFLLKHPIPVLVT
ncbi:MAG: alpha/beta hydrolase [Deltaproteobacteria bacterium]|nr:alpha/beta hydrolase [Deltaproteobacteria bacterium]